MDGSKHHHYNWHPNWRQGPIILFPYVMLIYAQWMNIFISFTWTYTCVTKEAGLTQTWTVLENDEPIILFLQNHTQVLVSHSIRSQTILRILQLLQKLPIDGVTWNMQYVLRLVSWNHDQAGIQGVTYICHIFK